MAIYSNTYWRMTYQSSQLRIIPSLEDLVPHSWKKHQIENLTLLSLLASHYLIGGSGMDRDLNNSMKQGLTQMELLDV
jgi:hypothetical protein